MIRIFFISFLLITNVAISDNNKLSRLYDSQLYDLYIDQYKKYENPNSNEIVYHNNYLISILKSSRSKNFKHQFRSEIENFINTNPKNITEELIREYGIYEFLSTDIKIQLNF